MADKVAMQTGTPEANVAVQHDPNVKIDHHGQGQLTEEQLTDHDKAMMAKVDENHQKALQAEGKAPITPEPAPEVEQFVMPEKFQGKSAEEIAKSYVELEKMKGNQGAQDDKSTSDPGLTIPSEETGGKVSGVEDKAVSADTGQPGDGTPAEPSESSTKVDFDKYIQEMSDTGTLTSESRKALVDAGYPEKLIDYNLSQVNAVTELTAVKVHTLAGGEENYKTMVEWAKTGMNQAEKADFNNKITSGDMDQVQIGMTYLKSIYEAKEGTIGANSSSLLSGQPGGAIQAEPYASWAQATKDMGAPEYKTDPAFRAKVESRLAVSDQL